MPSETSTPKRRLQFSIASLFFIMTLICVRLGLESSRTNRIVVMSIAVASTIAEADEQPLRKKLGDVESVTLIFFQGDTISVQARIKAKQEVLDVLRQHGLKVKSVAIR